VGLTNQLDALHQTRSGLALFGVVELALAYAAASWAIDSGRLLAWFLAVVLLVGGLQNIVKLVMRQFSGAR
jgi:uncharacterized membrane protein HdeD (DUF308 family)